MSKAAREAGSRIHDMWFGVGAEPPPNIKLGVSCNAEIIDAALVAEREAAKRLRDAARALEDGGNDWAALKAAIAAFDATQADEKERT